MSAFLSLSVLDDLALVVFVATWLGYPVLIRLVAPAGINAGLLDIRVLWMSSMMRRDNRIVDSALIGHVVHSASFFASTSLIAIGALIGVFTGIDRLVPAISGLGSMASREVLEIRVLLPLAVLVQGLFQLTWSLRQLNYVVALVGATPHGKVDEAVAGPLAEEMGGVLSSAVTTFNAGIRSYYFALVALSWLAGPWALMVATLGLAWVLVHRQRSSGVAERMRRARVLMLQAHGRPRE